MLCHRELGTFEICQYMATHLMGSPLKWGFLCIILFEIPCCEIVTILTEEKTVSVLI
jgi:hypothetical protein